MKSLKIIPLVVFFLGFIYGCGSNDKFISEDQVKSKIDSDLQGKLWKAVRYTEVIRNDKGETINYVDLDLNDAPLKTLTFKDKGISSVGSFAEYMTYTVSSVVFGLEVAPDPHILEIKNGGTVYFNMYLKHDYSYFSSEFKLKSNEKIYAIDFKLQ
ncbi:hypothetical protein [Sphingobacterium bovistauri]|uniref:Lipoprotein n=1 Tax=Sphingobacterium bovistauri TaxID=2781959 RepID=A0ABS7Z3S9_9SPHI|nr:hypothetical protein [Sphingobacterium bovistauri]MCA5003535.1 hypothetical protein [Sphingobacterium bovistauri]